MKLTLTTLMLSLVLVNLSCTQKKDQYSGYQLLTSFEAEDIGSQVVQLKHQKSGADVVLIKNNDPALSFMVGFKTPPYDDTGLFHIFEHAVLAGSRLYPSKSNFFNVADSTVASFINALTGAVYTMYPFVTRSEEDFFNLMPIYMDAVFFPNVTSDPRIIRREGWRYEVNDDKMSINGIVLSEMKSRFSSPYRTMNFHLGKVILPESSHSFESGGLPPLISTLTFEQIKQAHKKYYHPQNSVIYLYGDVDFSKALKMIDENFLSEFEKVKNFTSPKIVQQTRFDFKDKVVTRNYAGKSGPNKDFIAKGLVLGDRFTPLEEAAISGLLTAFAETEASPLKQRILRDGIAKSLYITGFGGRENGAAFVFEGSNAQSQKQLAEILDQEVAKVVKSGLDTELINAILNSMEFSFKEKNANGSHKGYQFSDIVMSQWLDKRWTLKETLSFSKRFKKLRLLMKDQTFIKNFFKNYLMKNDKYRWIIMKPDSKFSEKFNTGLAKQVEEALKEKDISEYKKDYEEYQKWVASTESKEILQKTPILNPKDITADEKAIAFEKIDKKGFELIQYPQNTSGIHYIDLYFDLKGVPEQQLKNLQLFTSFIQRTDSKNYPYQKLVKEISTWMGGLSFSVGSYQSHKDPKRFRPLLNVSARYLDTNTDKAIALVLEVLNNHQFSPEKHLKALFEETKSSLQSSISHRGVSLAVRGASRSFFPELSGFNSYLDGAKQIDYILNEQVNSQKLQQSLLNLGQQIFSKQRLVLASVTGPNKDLSLLSQQIDKIYDKLKDETTPDQNWDLAKVASYDGFIIPGEVQYLGYVTDYKNSGLTYDGSMLVYAQFLDNKYMLPQFREQAGAYGAGSSFSHSGLFYMYTYADPQLDASFKKLSKVPDFMNSLKLNDEMIKPALMGALKPYFRDKSIYGQVSTMDYFYLTEQTWDDYLKLKKQILATTPEDFTKITEGLKKSLEKAQKGVAGNESKIKKEAPFLNKTLNLK